MNDKFRDALIFSRHYTLNNLACQKYIEMDELLTFFVLFIACSIFYSALLLRLVVWIRATIY